MYSNELYHFGVKGMRWGVRRYTDENGNVTKAGKELYKQDVRKNKANYMYGKIDSSTYRQNAKDMRSVYRDAKVLNKAENYKAYKKEIAKGIGKGAGVGALAGYGALWATSGAIAGAGVIGVATKKPNIFSEFSVNLVDPKFQNKVTAGALAVSGMIAAGVGAKVAKKHMDKKASQTKN